MSDVEPLGLYIYVIDKHSKGLESWSTSDLSLESLPFISWA